MGQRWQGLGESQIGSEGCRWGVRWLARWWAGGVRLPQAVWFFLVWEAEKVFSGNEMQSITARCRCFNLDRTETLESTLTTTLYLMVHGRSDLRSLVGEMLDIWASLWQPMRSYVHCRNRLMGWSRDWQPKKLPKFVKRMIFITPSLNGLIILWALTLEEMDPWNKTCEVKYLYIQQLVQCIENSI